MFHQLQCLDIIRKAIVARVNGPSSQTKPTDLQRHCVNYLRQMVLCRADPHLEEVLGKPETIVLQGHQCMDWEAVYQALRDNHALHDYMERSKVGLTYYIHVSFLLKLKVPFLLVTFRLSDDGVWLGHIA